MALMADGGESRSSGEIEKAKGAMISPQPSPTLAQCAAADGHSASNDTLKVPAEPLDFGSCSNAAALNRRLSGA